MKLTLQSIIASAGSSLPKHPQCKHEDFQRTDVPSVTVSNKRYEPRGLIHYDSFSKTFCFKKKDFIYFFLERGREGEREGEKHEHVVASHVPTTRDLACNQTGNRLGFLSPVSYTSWMGFMYAKCVAQCLEFINILYNVC